MKSRKYVRGTKKPPRTPLRMSYDGIAVMVSHQARAYKQSPTDWATNKNAARACKQGLRMREYRPEPTYRRG